MVLIGTIGLYASGAAEITADRLTAMLDDAARAGSLAGAASSSETDEPNRRLCNRACDGVGCWPSAATIARKANICARMVRRVIALLEGEWHVVVHCGGRAGSTNSYTVVTGLHATGQPVSDLHSAIIQAVKLALTGGQTFSRS